MYEADCPSEFKELYAQKKIALDNYIHHHNTLVAAYYSASGEALNEPKLSTEETFAIGKAALDNFNENQLIYDEFHYYQGHKKVLGVHPVFRVYKLKESISKMRESNAVKRLSNLVNYINRDTRKLNQIKDPEKRHQFERKIMIWKEERDLIKSIKKLDE